ncbi:myelin and lymphocyte protein-like isoform X1 [Sander vitreus]
MAETTAQPMGSLPSRLGICTTAPDIFYLPELVFGGLVWILVASTHVDPPNPLGWVMFVSVFCFVMTFLWLVIFASGAHQNSSGWAAADFAYHGLAVLFYLSAGVDLAYITLMKKSGVRLLGHTPLLHPHNPLLYPMEKLLKSDAESQTWVSKKYCASCVCVCLCVCVCVCLCVFMPP